MATKKQAGAGRGFVNPQRTDESDDMYVTPKQRYDMEKQMQEEKTSAQTDKAYNKAAGYAKGGPVAKYMKFSDSGKPMGMAPVTKAKGGMTASKRADGIAQRGKTRGTTVAMCGGGMYKK